MIGANIGIEDFTTPGACSIGLLFSLGVVNWGSIYVLAANFVAYIIPTNVAKALTGTPTSKTIPKSALNIPAAAMGPGVGGTNVCVAVRPNPSATAGPAKEMPAFFDKVLLSEDTSKKPLSAYTGMERKRS